jgi:glycosyltransferase involved in cell wall biosynthesis
MLLLKAMVDDILIGALGLLLLIVVICLVRFERNIRNYIYTEAQQSSRLPTVSVCIPARNEVHAMTQCLERVIASDYPKLEIIVLDDSSVDDTSVLIKSFAHAGVRFVEGRQLPDGWLGKNNALQGLLEEASGQYILYLDVDTIVRPDSISKLVASMTDKSVSLVSVLPQREDGLRASVFLGTMRYFWMLLMSSKQTPAVSGACWMVDRERLIAKGGFTNIKDQTQPEDCIARAISEPEGSQLMISTDTLGISYEKKWSSQIETSVRLLKPLFESTFNSLVVALVLVLLVIVPVFALVLSFVLHRLVLGGMAAATLLVVTILSLRYFRLVWRHGWWLGAIHWPYVVLQETVLLAVSSLAYRKGTVTWKGRPIRLARDS